MIRKTSCVRLLVAFLGVLLLSGCLFRRNRAQMEPLDPGEQPDKVLYERAVHEIDRGRYEVGRLTLQTLINTYPDSEFLAKAKLAIADSYYNEGGVSGLTQAEAEYKDFITFFPTAPEAPNAQYKAALARFRMMGKADRDRTEAKMAEAELKEFLLKYPDHPLMPRVKARLRQVQEVLAQGEFGIARLYFQRGANRAAKARFEEIAVRYPNFSRADEALWYLGQTLERLRAPDAASVYYARVITEHPLSPRAEAAKERLNHFEKPIPTPTRAMLARAEADAHKYSRRRRDLLQRIAGIFSSAPNTSMTRRGPVRLGMPPPTEVEVATTPAPAGGTGTLVVKPVGPEALKEGTPVPATPAGDGAEGSSGTPARETEQPKP